MTELSLNEVESLAAKVGRGGGFSWGLAEEIGRSARRLAQGGLPWADALLALAEKSRKRCKRLRRLERNNGEGAESETLERAAVPGARRRAADRRSGDPAGRGLCVLRTSAFRIWIAGMLAASGVADGFEIAWPGGFSIGRPARRHSEGVGRRLAGAGRGCHDIATRRSVDAAAASAAPRLGRTTPF